MVADTREYDSFGPWIPEVRTAEDVPRLYRDHPLDVRSADLVLKVPRNIARRDASAEMDLYDHLLALQQDGLTVLSRWQDQRTAGPGRYEIQHVAYDQVAIVLDEVSLLDGHLRLYTLDGHVLTVSYNGSGAESLQRLVERLRVLAAHAAPPRPPVSTRASEERGPRLLPASALGRDDVGLVSAHRDIAGQRPDLLTLAWHGRQTLRPRSGVLRRLSHALSPATLHACIIAGDDETLEVIGRRDWVTRGRKPDHSLSRLVILRRALDRIEADPHPLYVGATTVTFMAGNPLEHRRPRRVRRGTRAVPTRAALTTSPGVDRRLPHAPDRGPATDAREGRTAPPAPDVRASAGARPPRPVLRQRVGRSATDSDSPCPPRETSDSDTAAWFCRRAGHSGRAWDDPATTTNQVIDNGLLCRSR